MEIKFTSKSAQECKELEDAVKIFFDNCTLSGKDVYGFHCEKVPMFIRLNPIEGFIDSVSINKNRENNPARITISMADRTYIDIGNTVYVVLRNAENS